MIRYNFQLSDYGWVTSAEWTTDKTKTAYLCTNLAGDGIFYVDPARNERKQLVGTCDFSVWRCTPATARNRIRRYMSKDEEL